MYIEYIHPNFLHLQKEVLNHPKLCEYIDKYKGGEMELKLAEIATYCNVIVDGDYSPDQLNELAGILTKRLQHIRMAEL
jgi:hypothetical protein